MPSLARLVGRYLWGGSSPPADSSLKRLVVRLPIITLPPPLCQRAGAFPPLDDPHRPIVTVFLPCEVLAIIFHKALDELEELLYNRPNDICREGKEMKHVLLLAVLCPLLSFADDDIKVPNVWQIPYASPSAGALRSDFGFTWDPAGNVWESLSGVVTVDYWGNRYGFLALRLTEGIGQNQNPRIFVADVDGDGPSFENFGAGWTGDATTKSQLTKGDDYTLVAGPPGALEMAGNWVYVFHGQEGTPKGTIKTVTDPLGRVYQFNWDLQNPRVEVIDPTGAHPIRIQWYSVPYPSSDVILQLPPYSDTTKYFGRIRASVDQPQVPEGADWGTNIGELNEVLEFLETLTAITVQNSATATLVDQWSSLESYYEHNPDLPFVSVATQKIGSHLPYAIGYLFNNAANPELYVKYGRSLGNLTHQFKYTHNPSGNTTVLDVTSLQGYKFNNATSTPSMQMDLDSQGLPTRIEMDTEFDGVYGNIEATINRQLNGNVWKITDFRGFEWNVSWNGFNPVFEEEPTGFALNYDYETDWYIGNGQYDPNTHNPVNARTQIWNGANDKWHINYNSIGDLAEVWAPGINSPSKYSYFDSSSAFAGWPEKIVDPIGRIGKVLDYTDFGKAKSVRFYPQDDPSTPSVIEGGEANGVTTQVSYNVLGQPTQILYNDANHFDMTYDDSKLVEATDERGRIFNVAYNPTGSSDTGFPDKVSAPNWTDWEGQSYPARDMVSIEFNSLDQPSAVMAGNGARETYYYGAFEEQTATVFDSWDGSNVVSLTESYNYTSDGLIRQIVRPSSETISHTYNKNRWLTKSAFGNTTHEFGLDLAGNVLSAKVSVSASEARRTDFVYDYDTNRLSTMTQFPNGPGTGYGIEYLYNPDGSVSRETLKLGSTVLQRLNYYYDDSGLVASIVDDTTSPSETSGFIHDGAGRLVVVSMANDKLETEFFYGGTAGHGHGFLERVDHRKITQMLSFGNPGAVFAHYNYTPYPDNTPATCAEWVNLSSTNVSWKYDPYGQLRQEVRGSTTNNFSYDLGGNLTNWGTRSFTEYNAGGVHTNQLATESTGVSYQYDPNGTRSQRVSNTGTYGYLYDALDNLTEVQLDGSPVYKAEYDAMGLRVKQTVGSFNSYFLYNQFGELIAELDGNGNLVARYVWGPTGPIYRVAGSARRYYIYDGLGHTRLLVNNQATITDRYTYDAWGNITSQTGSTANPFRWNAAYGYQYIPATKLYHVGAREYDPSVGRWMQRDPVGVRGGDANVYSYAGNRPITAKDPSGAYIDTAIDIGWTLGNLIAGFIDAANGNDEAAEDHFIDAAIGGVCSLIPFVTAPAVKALMPWAKKSVGWLSRSAGFGACFPAGTPVKTPSGYTAIDELTPGATILAKDESTGQIVHTHVVNNITCSPAERIHFTFDSSGALEVTAEHPLYKVGSGWVPASQLAIGDWLVTHSDQVQITQIDCLPAITVYNLSVEDPHTFFVGADEVWAHNKWTANLPQVIKNAYVTMTNAYRASRLASKMRNVVQLGRVGEVAAGIEKNTERIKSITKTANYRIPDILNDVEIGDVKNWSRKVGLSNQLKDYILHAEKFGLRFILRLRSKEIGISSTLREFLDQTLGSGGYDITDIFSNRWINGPWHLPLLTPR